MTQPYADPFVQFGELDLNFDEDDAPPTWPSPGSALLVIVDKFEPLFTSATWTLIASVNGDILAKTHPKDVPHTAPYIKRWSRQFIRSHYVTLRRLGVDAEAEYVKLGGALDELKP